MMGTLNNTEQRLCKFVARMRSQINRDNGVRDRKKGSQSGYDTDLNGFGAELAFCKEMNIYPDMQVKITSQKTDIGDAFFAGKSFDVKTTQYKTGKLICALWKNDSVDYYVLVVGKFPHYEVIGYISAESLKRKENLTDLGRGDLYAVEQCMLRPISKLGRLLSESQAA